MLLYSMTRFFKFLPGEQRQVAAIAQLLPSNRTGERVLPNTRLAAKTIFIGSTPDGLPSTPAQHECDAQDRRARIVHLPEKGKVL